MNNSLEKFLNKNLAQLELENLLRTPKTSAVSGVYITRAGKKMLNFSSNDYLGLSQHPQIVEAAIKATNKYGAGAQASRLVTGNHPLYDELETEIANYYKTDAACVFGSGYMANIGVITSLIGQGVGKNNLIITDKLAHACIIDGAQLSGAEFKRFKHNDLKNLQKILEQNRAQYKNCLVVTESIFSMDGDAAPLEQMQQICAEYDAWLMVDFAHQIKYQQSSINYQTIIMGTLSKAFGSYGGYIAGSKQLVNYLKTTARSLIYTTGLPPATIASATESFKVIKQNPKILQTPIKMAMYFCNLMNLPEPQSQIVPIIIGSPEKALKVQKQLEDIGFLVSAIRPPTVPVNTSRLRVSFTALHSKRHIENLATALKKIHC